MGLSFSDTPLLGILLSLFLSPQLGLGGPDIFLAESRGQLLLRLIAFGLAPEEASSSLAPPVSASRPREEASTGGALGRRSPLLRRKPQLAFS